MFGLPIPPSEAPDSLSNLDLRDYFAAAALQAMVSRQPHEYENAADKAYAYADAMMEERKK